MDAWRSGDQQDVSGLQLARVPLTENGKNLRVKVHAAAINFSDILMVQDRYQVKPPRPFIPGQEIAGTVVYAPDGCRFSVGDRVASKVDWGGFAEYCSIPVDMPFRIPDDVPMTTAAALPVSYTTAIVALTECANVQSDSQVLVNAASGAIGLASVELASTLGARVIAAASSKEKRALALSHGALVAVDYTDTDWITAVKTTTGGHGADIIVDPVGGDIGEQSLRALARDGTLLIIGFASGRIQNLPANRLLLKRASAKGVYWNHRLDPDMMRRCTDRLTDMLSMGCFKPETTVFAGLESLPRALDDLKNRRSVGKLVLDLTTEKEQQ